MEEGPDGLRSFLKDDPFAFGKGGEVLECLHAQGVPLPEHNNYCLMYFNLSKLARGHHEMTSFSPSPRDRILWILANNGGTMERSRLRACTGMRYVLLNPILEELGRDGRIKIASEMDGDLISLRER